MSQKNIFETGELDKDSVISILEIAQQEGFAHV